MTCINECFYLLSYRKNKIYFMVIACAGVLQRESHSARATQCLTSPMEEQLWLSMVENTCGVNGALQC